jgi:hypothetical protein
MSDTRSPDLDARLSELVERCAFAVDEAVCPECRGTGERRDCYPSGEVSNHIFKCDLCSGSGDPDPRTLAQAVLSAANHAELLEKNEQLCAALTQARADFAALLRGHTRAIWTLKNGEPGYPEAERQATGRAGSEALARINAVLASSLETDTEDGGRDE